MIDKSENVIRDIRMEARAANKRMREIHRMCAAAGFAPELTCEHGILSFRLTKAGEEAVASGKFSEIADRRDDGDQPPPRAA